MSSSEGGGTGRRTDWSCLNQNRRNGEIAEDRPFSSRPGSTDGRGYTDFDPNGKQKADGSTRFCRLAEPVFAALLDISGPSGVFRRNFRDIGHFKGRG